MTILRYVVADNSLVDVWRTLVVLASGLLIVMCLVRLMQQERFWSAIAIGSTAVLGGLQESEQLGKPMLVWRLPLLTLSIIAGIRYMYYTTEQIKAGPRH